MPQTIPPSMLRLTGLDPSMAATHHKPSEFVKAGSARWVSLKPSTLGLKHQIFRGVSETPHGEWGIHGGAGLCMLKPDSTGRCTLLLLKNAPGTHDEGQFSIPGGALETIDESGQPEDALHCALRETHEEVHRLPEAEVWTNPIVLRNVQTGFCYRYFLCLLPPNSQWNPSIRGEHIAYKWQSLDYALQLSDLHPGLHSAVQQMPKQWADAFKFKSIILPAPIAQGSNRVFITEGEFVMRNLETPLATSITEKLDVVLTPQTKTLIEQAGSTTELWLTQHPNQIPPGWDHESLESLPVNIPKLIALEREHAKSHVVAYHAFADNLLPGHWVGEVLMRNLIKPESQETQEQLNHVSWLRNPFEFNKNRYRDVHNLMHFTKTHPSKDNGEVGRFCLLSCNPSLFQNTNIDAMESTADYLYDAINVAPPQIKTWISSMLKSRFPSHAVDRIEKATEDIIHLCAQMSKVLPDEKKAGVLMQILIPHALVNDIAYISKSNGIPDDDNPNALQTLVQLKVSQHTVASTPNAQSLQLRLLACTLQDPKVAKHLKVNLLSRYTDSQQDAIKSRIQDIVENLEIV